MDLAPVDVTFDETIYAVVSTGKAIETADAGDLFQTSFRTLLDGSEFMAGIFEQNDDAKAEEEEEDQMDAAIRTGMKMARRCSCPSVGSYKPFYAADPTTWKKKRSKSPRRQQSKSPSRKKKEKHTSHRRSTSPMVSSYVLEQQEVADQERKKDEDRAKTERKKLRHSRYRRSSSPMASSYVLEQQVIHEDSEGKEERHQTSETRMVHERSQRRSTAPMTTSYVLQLLEQANEARKKEEQLCSEEKSSHHCCTNSPSPNAEGEEEMYQKNETRIHERSQRHSTAPISTSYPLQVLEQANEDRKKKKNYTDSKRRARTAAQGPGLQRNSMTGPQALNSRPIKIATEIA